MVMINYDCYNQTVPEGTFGGAMCMCVKCERERMEKKNYHTKCHDCGRFLFKEKWVSRQHPWKKHALCSECHSNYDHPGDL